MAATRPASSTLSIDPLIVTRRRTAEYLGVSLSQVGKFERAGKLTPIRPDATSRAKRYIWSEVQALGQSWISRAREAAVR